MSSDLELFNHFIAHDDFVDFMCELAPLLHNGSLMKDSLSLLGRMRWLKETTVSEWEKTCKSSKKTGYVGVDILKRFNLKIMDAKSQFKAKFESLLEELELKELSKTQAILNTQSQALARQIEERTAKRQKI